MATAPTPRIIPQHQRPYYGIRLMQVLATNNPSSSCIDNGANSTWSPQKNIATVVSPDFARVFESRMHSSIVTRIQASSLPANCQWVLHVFRMGFEEENMPIVVHVLVPHDCLPDSDAYTLVEEIGSIVAAEWDGRAVYVDVCQKRFKTSDLLHGNNEGVDLSARFGQLYSFDAPLPGFSIGPKTANVAGSFTGFIKIQDRFYGLTCDHVINGLDSTVIGPRAYNYVEGDEKLIVTMPARKDHEDTQDGILEHLARTESPASWPSREDEMKFWGAVKKQAQDFETELGHIIATSGQDRSGTYYHGALDWAYFEYGSRFGTSNARNRHPPDVGYYTGTGTGFQIHDGYVRRRLREELGANFVDEARDYFRTGPNFKPLREKEPSPDEIFFKIASRSSDLVEARFSEIKATMNLDGRRLTREYCYVRFSTTNAVSLPGDSGSVLLDSEFRPTAMVWGGLEGQYPDVTYATPLHVVLRDIERRGGFPQGSATYC